MALIGFILEPPLLVAVTDGVWKFMWAHRAFRLDSLPRKTMQWSWSSGHLGPTLATSQGPSGRLSATCSLSGSPTAGRACENSLAEQGKQSARGRMGGRHEKCLLANRL